jgi:AbiV family abortive infection protein
MTTEDIRKYNEWRKLCLANARDALRAAEALLGKNLNHIVCQLSVLVLEEVGKIYVQWFNISNEDTWERNKKNIPLDDHTKKLFWAFWWPTLTRDRITQDRVDSLKRVASSMHDRRLEVMYTDANDTSILANKVSDAEAAAYYNAAKATLELAEMDGDLQEDAKPSEGLQWLMGIMNHPDRRSFVFGATSQDKLIGLQSSDAWIEWLKNHFQKEEEEMQRLATMELSRKTNTGIEKWRVKIRVISQSHSIRQNILNEFNKTSEYIKLTQGDDNKTLFIEFIFDDEVNISQVWNLGWLSSKHYVIALNIATNGLLYWHTKSDLDKYYEQIRDVEGKKNVLLTMTPALKLDWSDRMSVLSPFHLNTSLMVLHYISSRTQRREARFIESYAAALAMFAMSDIHLRMEASSFIQFHESFKQALLFGENCKEEELIEVGYQQLEGMIADKDNYVRLMTLAAESTIEETPEPISLADVVLMKQYAGSYIMTMAARRVYGKNDIRLTLE